MWKHGVIRRYTLGLKFSSTWGAMRNTPGSHRQAGDAVVGQWLYQEIAKGKMATKFVAITTVSAMRACTHPSSMLRLYKGPGHEITLCLAYQIKRSRTRAIEEAGVNTVPKATVIKGWYAGSPKQFCYPLNKN